MQFYSKSSLTSVSSFDAKFTSNEMTNDWNAFDQFIRDLFDSEKRKRNVGFGLALRCTLFVFCDILFNLLCIECPAHAKFLNRDHHHYFILFEAQDISIPMQYVGLFTGCGTYLVHD